MFRDGRKEIPRGDDDQYNHHAKKNYAQMLTGTLQPGTCAVSILEIDRDGSLPQLKGGMIVRSDHNEMVWNYAYINNDRDLMNRTVIIEIDQMPQYLARKLIEMCSVRADPKNQLKPVVGAKTGHLLVSVMLTVIETSPDDILETSIRNPEMHNRHVQDIRVMRKKPANPKYPNYHYDPLEDFEKMELDHHNAHKRG